MIDFYWPLNHCGPNEIKWIVFGSARHGQKLVHSEHKNVYLLHNVHSVHHLQIAVNMQGFCVEAFYQLIK